MKNQERQRDTGSNINGVSSWNHMGQVTEQIYMSKCQGVSQGSHNSPNRPKASKSFPCAKHWVK